MIGYWRLRLPELSWYTDPVQNQWGLFSSRKALLRTLRDAVLLALALLLLWSM